MSDQLAYRIILVYGPQETESAEERERFMTDVAVEVQHSKDNNEVPILLGDFNAKMDVATNGEVIPESGNGRLLCELVKEQELDIINFSAQCEGKWTHVIRTTEAKSCLDYVITSKSFSKSVKSMLIDEDCVICPFSVKKKKGKCEEKVFSDHNSIILEAVIDMPKRVQQENRYIWKLPDDSKVQLLQLTSTENFTPPPRSRSPQTQYDNFEKEVNKLLKAVALCIKIKDKPNHPGKCPKRFLEIFKMLAKFGARGKIQRRVAAQYKNIIINLNGKEVRRERARRLKDTISSLTISGRFSRQQFWKVRKSVYRKFESCSSVQDRNGKEVFEDHLIRKAYQEEFMSRLSHRQISPPLTEYESKTNELAAVYVEEAELQKGPPISLKELDYVIDNLKNGAPGSDAIPVDFYANIGCGFKDYLLGVLNDLKEASWIPHQWQLTLITTIYKNKGTRKVLRNYRGIFLTQIISKIYEKIMILRSKEALNKVTKLQAGSRSNRGSLDNLFLLQGCIDHAKHLNVSLYVTVYDFAQCFDALWLEDCIVSLWKLGIRDETLSTLYNMNKEAIIQVNTPVGTSSKFSQETIVKQGTVSGPPMCSTSTAEFAAMNKVRGFPIGNFSVSTMILVDDILNTNSAPDDVIESHENMEEFSEVKRLPVNGKKCFVLPVNTKDHHKIPSLKHKGIRLEIVDSVLYLGNMFNDKGNNKDKVKDRTNKAKAVMIDTLSLCSELTLGVYMVQSLLLTHNMMFLPTLLYGAQTWTNFTAEDSKQIKTIQLKFLKRILRVPASACNAVVFLELGVLPALWEIHIMKLTFLHHILTLEDDDPVKLMYQEQLKIPHEKNWANEVAELRSIYLILDSDEEIAAVSKEEWKAEVHNIVKTQAVVSLNEEKNALTKSSVYPDAENLKTSKYLSFFTVSNACLLFRVRCRIVDTKDLHQYKYGDDKVCRCCGVSDETLAHVLGECPALTSQRCAVGDEFSDDLGVLEKVVLRVQEFVDIVEEETAAEEE